MLTYLTYIDYFKYTTTTDTYTLSLHDALPILVVVCMTRLRINHLKNGFYEMNKLHIRLYKLASSVNVVGAEIAQAEDRKSTRLNSSHVAISYAVFCLKKKKKNIITKQKNTSHK